MNKRIPTPEPGQLTVQGIINAWANRMHYSVGRGRYTATDFDAFQALAFSVRDRLIDRWFTTQDAYYKNDAKRVYYLSLEFLMGRALLNNILNLGAYDAYAVALEELGYRLEELADHESEPGLGNGGLGRLAACFLDSAATLDLPMYGYGIRYEYGIFGQQILDGFQIETPDNWLRYENPWEIPRPDTLFPVKFYGRTSYTIDENGKERFDWVDTQDTFAMAYDTPVVGFRNDTVNTLRLWAAKSSREFDLARFNAGEYVQAVEEKTRNENISKVLYPPDDQYAGKELRLKQQYFFVSATLQDVMRRFKKKSTRRWEDFPDKVAIQLNDTHPAIAIPELMRVFLDIERLDWEQAWEITQSVFGYTNHTILAEALEAWPVEMMNALLPRHLQIIREIDRRFAAEVRARYPKREDKVRHMAIIDEQWRVVRMAHLAIVGSHSVNGVAKLHTHILKHTTFPDFNDFFPGRFNNKTNGVTPRRFLLKANPRLSRLITEAIGDRWVADLDELKNLKPFTEDAEFRAQWTRAKLQNKQALADWTKKKHNLTFDPESMLDCQVKRIHEYKRQLLSALHAISLYHRMLDGEDIVPRTILFAGKAAPSYLLAKLIIKMIDSIGQLVNDDPIVKGRLKVLFIPNYSVSAAEMIFPACELSEQISTAGMEASGTGNMKAAMNGAMTIGTLDGANIEIREEVGEQNIFIFGKTAAEIDTLRAEGYNPRAIVEANAQLKAVIERISVLPGQPSPGLFQPIIEALLSSDRYFNCVDFESYIWMQQHASATYRMEEDWTKKSILNVAGMGAFSADRTVREYATDIWKVAPLLWEA